KGWSPRQRAAAAWALGRSGRKEDRDRVVPLLADASAPVRYRAAEALVLGGDARGVPGLIALLEKGPLDAAASAEALLTAVAGAKAPAEGLSGDPQERRKCA